MPRVSPKPLSIALTRQFWVVAHRWAGLTITLFLVVAGATGALLPWNQELTLAGRPGLAAVTPPRAGAKVLDAVTLAERVEAQTGAKVSYFDFATPDRHVATVSVVPPAGSTLSYDTVWVDPYTGAIRLTWRYSRLSDGPQAIMSFLYKLHRELALGRFGQVALGLAALIWTIDCFVGFYLTLPVRRSPLHPTGPARSSRWWSRWRPAWRVRWGGGFRLTFDLHRAGGLWLWPVLLVFAWSSVGLNLPEVETPVMRLFGGTPYVGLPTTSVPLDNPPLTLRQAQARGDLLLRGIGEREGFTVGAPSGMIYTPAQAAYRYMARSSLDVGSEGGLTAVSFSARDGRLLRFEPPVDRNPANGVTAWLNMLHFAQVLGWPYRAFVSLVGSGVVVLTVTGVLIWMRKRSARLMTRRSRRSGA